MGKFSNALGVWDLKINDIELELKPDLKDVRSFRKLLMSEQVQKQKDLLFDRFADFMSELIKKQYPNEPDDDVKGFIEVNINSLFEEAMIAFKWTTKEQLEQSKKESVEGLKKMMSNA